MLPQTGAWDDVSGETFLRTLLSMPVQAAKFRTVWHPSLCFASSPGSSVVDFHLQPLRRSPALNDSK